MNDEEIKAEKTEESENLDLGVDESELEPITEEENKESEADDNGDTN